MSDPFYGPKLKVHRAQQHIDELARLFEAYRTQNPDGVARSIDSATGSEIQKVGGGFPEHTPTIMGDAIHNLRSSLDHAFCILVTANGHTPNKYTAFPFRDDEIALAGVFKGIRAQGHAPSADVENIIVKEIKPLKGTRFYGLHDLDIADKHRTLLPTLSAVQGRNMTIGNSQFINCSFSSLSGLHTNQFGGSAIMVVGPPGHSSTRISGDFSAKIVFPGGTPFAGKDIIPTLNEMRKLVIDALIKLEPHAK